MNDKKMELGTFKLLEALRKPKVESSKYPISAWEIIALALFLIPIIIVWRVV